MKKYYILIAFLYLCYSSYTAEDDELKNKETNLTSNLAFCLDVECQKTANKPSGHLYINRLFYLKHSIKDHSLYIDNPLVTFEGADFKYQLFENDFQVIKRALGYSIYALRVPLASEGVNLTVTAKSSGGDTIITDIKLKDKQKTSLDTVYEHLDDNATLIEELIAPAIEASEFIFKNSIHTQSFVSRDVDIDEEHLRTRDEEPLLVDYSNDRLHKVQQDNLENLQSNPTIKSSFGGNSNDRQNTVVDQPELTCETDSQFLYNGQCLQKSCLFKKLQRVRMTPLHKYSSSPRKLENHIVYKVESIEKNNGRAYRVELAYGDEKDNQLVSEPEKCIDWRVYQTKNHYDIDNKRMNMPTDALVGTTPVWPKATYTYVDEMKAGRITFDVSHDDLDEYKCLKFNNDERVSYECFFEFALVVKRTTQISYYFSLRVAVNSNNVHDLQLLEVAIDHVSQ